ncbi:MAG: histidine--tRNA ligase [Acidobacteria bacterium]|nr:histidine--tRNA ligase [Acidobacteriota bacterium]
MAESLINNLPGTRDLLPEELVAWHVVEDCARRIFRQYGFLEIRTPIIEPTELFARGIGEDTDIVGKEMYTFLDRGNRSVTLRPEATASVVRAYIQNALYRGSGITKLFYFGPMFRYEKKQKGRWRQFYQAGVEVFGPDHPAIDAEVIEMALRFTESLGVEASLQINSIGCRRCRPPYLEILRRRLQGEISGLCEDCRRRAHTNSLRVFDCKVETCQPIILNLPSIADNLCSECSEHFSRVKKHLDDAGVAYETVPGLVRGLDYYVRTAFEIVSRELGAQNTIIGGGRYDGLSEVIGGPPVKAIGFAVGLDRLAMILPEEKRRSGVWRPDLFIAYKGEAAFRRALLLARDIRRRERSCMLDFSDASLKSQMRLANKINAAHVLIVGDDELSRDTYTLKRMHDSRQWEVTPPELTEYLASCADQGEGQPRSGPRRIE